MSGFFSPATLDRVRAASDIVDVIGTYIPLKRAGANFVALCPFHKEKSPSFNVNPHKQIFHCFGCHKGGDVFSFVKEYENLTFPEAVKRLADRAKIPLDLDNSPGAQESRDLKGRLLEIHDQLTQRWQNALANEASGQVARDYLAKRGVSAEAIKLFRIGAAPEAWDDTVNWARSKNFDLELVEKAGLIIKKEGTDRYYDRFRGRLMFPICDEQGRVIGFSGRVLSGDEKTAKYVNSPETPIFTKSKVFFGLDKSRRALLDAGFAIICEGQLDLIACFMAGVQNIVAPQGTAFTEQHSRILKRYVNEVVLCFDSDEAGQNAAVRSLDHLIASGLAVRVAVVPRPHDPDSFIKANGSEAFKQLIAGADGFFDYYLKRLCVQNDTATDKGRLVVLQSMGDAVHKTGSAVLIDKYAQKTALRLGVTADAVRAEFKKVSRHQPVIENVSEESPLEVEELARPSAHEFWLLKLLFLHEELASWALAHLDPGWIQNPMAREVITSRLAVEGSQGWTTLGAFLDQCDSMPMRSLITEAATEDRPIKDPGVQMADVVLRLRNLFIDRQMLALTQQLNHPDTADSTRTELLMKQQELRSWKRQPLAPLGEA
ncbi:MAG: DNA primase [Verrucomicrobiota bacterium]